MHVDQIQHEPEQELEHSCPLYESRPGTPGSLLPSPTIWARNTIGQYTNSQERTTILYHIDSEGVRSYLTAHLPVAGKSGFL
jgi:hypothetical protein